MIPTLILFGLLFGRWWWMALLASAIGWPVLIVIDGTMAVEPALAGAAGLAVLNTGVGVLVHQGVLWAYRWVRQAMGSRPRP